jgi:hypothetical protein
VRRYRVELPASASFLTLETAAEQPPEGDRRWLGVTIYGLEAATSGLSLRTVARALGLALGGLLAVLALVWGAGRGFGADIALFLLALVPRVVLLDVSPAGWRTDEVVSLVDAWNIARTGRDHLGHLLPLGAQEALGDWISPLLTYLELPFVAVFGPHRLAGRLVTAAFGALAAPLCYRLARALLATTEGQGPRTKNQGHYIGLWTLVFARSSIASHSEVGAVFAGLAAALSPWQMFMSRTALPPALVPTSWAACLLAALLFLRRGGRREALLLASVAGLALYAYPTMKLAVPLLVALAVVLALWRYGWAASRRWFPAAPLLALLWLPFAYVTLFVPASSTRLDQTAIAASTWGEWLAGWWRGYSVYFLPGFYFVSGDGSPIRGVPGHGAELLVTAPLVVLGLLYIIYRVIADCRLQIADWRGTKTQSTIYNLQSAIEWWFIAGAILIAPLAASLTQPSPHAYRAATIAPLYALLAGVGAAVLWRLLERVARRRVAQGVVAGLLVGGLAWQAGAWFRDYTGSYPPRRAWENQDGLAEAIERAITRARDFDEVWISYEEVNEPYIYLLAARPMPPAEAQARIEVRRRPGHLNDILGVGPYRFASMDGVPRDLPALDAIPDSFGGPAFVVQGWEQGGKRVLIVRRME